MNLIFSYLDSQQSVQSIETEINKLFIDLIDDWLIFSKI